MPQFRTRMVRPAMLTSREDGDELVATSVATSRNGLVMIMVRCLVWNIYYCMFSYDNGQMPSLEHLLLAV